ncbi:hybrid sensor histidine kinase/response regulator [Roseobacter denitrificans]|nr:ATP-binding protein [Roseobacter denitrificans]AVL54738.1 hybrid sensor histidine kinase/response regulator [Roseobacter denitrificans]
MSTSAILPSKLTEFALGAQNRFAGILVGAAVLAIVGLAAPHEVLQKSLLAAATALIVLCGVLYGLVGAHGRRQKATLATLSSFIDKDAVPGFLTRADGEILSRNQAARSRFQGQAGDTLIGALDRTVADPAAILSRLQTRADTEGFAQEELVTRKGHIRVGVNKAGANAYAWRFEDVAVAAAQNDGPALPMILVGRTNAILYMNDPARDLVGGRVTSLERLFKTMPVQSGTVCDIEGVEGPARVLVSEVSAGAGRKALYLLPPGPASVRDDEWNVFENLPVPLLKVGADGQVQAFNLMASNLIGIALERDVHLSDLMEGLGRSITDWLTDTLAGRASQPTEFLRLKRTDKEVFVQVTLNRISESGDPTLIAVLSDATELKSLEAQFVQSQKMQAIGQLAGGVAHDFNNLLTAISGHCDLLLLRHDQGDPDFSDLVQINQNANRAAALVGQLLAFSRKQTLRPETLDMRDTLADLTHLLNRLVGEKVTLTLTHDPVLLPIRADKRQLEQVLMNLVVNARDAMPNGGEIRIETQCIRLKAPLNRDRVTVPVGEYVTVHVSDDGIGIPSDKLQKVFEPFYTTKRTGEGTGLGLSTAYGIVKQTGAYIFVDSTVGVGTRFTLYFPVLENRKPAPVAPRVETKKPTGKHGDGVILLVEDEAPVRAFASRALRLRGYTVLEADSAEAALKTLEDETLNVDVFVTDVVMPGMDGPSWVREALKNRPDVRVVFVSGYAEDSFGEAQMKIPNSVFLPKPFSLNDLTDTVHEQLH